MKPFDGVYTFKGFVGCASKCRLRVMPLLDGRVVVICSELPDNPGTSVTNSAEHLATAVCAEFGIDPAKLVWIEHYPSREGCQKAQWDRVRFQLQRQGGKAVLTKPEWCPMRPKDWRDLGLQDWALTNK